MKCSSRMDVQAQRRPILPGAEVDVPMTSGVLWFDPLRCLVLSFGEGNETALRGRRRTS
jgi:hypothetical protein